MDTDDILLDSYIATMDALAEYLGEAYELVLHDLRKPGKPIIKIINGFNPGRRVGDPLSKITIMMMDMVEEKGKYYNVYYTKNLYGKPMQATAIFIKGQKNQSIGMLCINLNLRSPMTAFLSRMDTEKTLVFEYSNLVNNPEEVIKVALEEAKEGIYTDDSIPKSMKNKEIIRVLSQQGIFKFKKAIDIISEELKISKSTVYLHMRGED
jgi:predicted transcriptional regulator YheO